MKIALIFDGTDVIKLNYIPMIVQTIGNDFLFI